MRRHPALVPILSVLAASLVLGLLLADQRPLHADEGYYASAARLTLQGAAPYLDYFYPQSPLLPYL